VESLAAVTNARTVPLRFTSRALVTSLHFQDSNKSAGFRLRSAAGIAPRSPTTGRSQIIRIKGKVINSSISDCRIQIFQSLVGKLEPFDTATDEIAFWPTNRNVEKINHTESASARGGFRRARLVQFMARLRQSRLSEKISLALARRCFGLRLHLDRRKRAKNVAG
jgi:hypothetical protein